MVESDRPPFDLNLAVVLAGFAFEAYTTPPENVGWREMDAAECQTLFLSEQFLREVYIGQIFIKLRKGANFPALDPWGTSDPYVILQLGDQVAKSKVKWATKDPIWNEDFTLNIDVSRTNILQVAAWDANLVTPHKRMGNAGLNLEALCDGNLHEVDVELEGIGGGGKIYLEVKYKSYDEINNEKKWWNIPFVSDILMKSNLGYALRLAIGSESVNVSKFVQSAFGQLKPLYFDYLQKMGASNPDKEHHTDSDRYLNSSNSPGHLLQTDINSGSSVNKVGSGKLIDSPAICADDAKGKGALNDLDPAKQGDSLVIPVEDAKRDDSLLDGKLNETLPSVDYFWKTFAESIDQSVPKKLGIPLPEIKLWEGFDLLNKTNLQSQKIAEEMYIESGLATPVVTSETKDEDSTSNSASSNITLPLILDVKKATQDVLSQMEAILGVMMVVAANISQQKKDSISDIQNEEKTDVMAEEHGIGNNTNAMAEAEDSVGRSLDKTGTIAMKALSSDTQKEDERRKIFSSAESAMEAWAMLATSLGRNSFIKSDFEKICFLDNVSTDTQVAVWRDYRRRRLVIAFRGTEQSSWKDLRTDLMLLPAGLNPERLGGDFKQEVQVHSGFLNAYDSVRNRLTALIRLSIGYSEDDMESMTKWHVYITGHSLGGALATLLALELSSGRMAKCGAISVTMYNFGSPRVGNRKFAELYNEKVKDSWRVVNHRDIIPTIPRLMGYCHVAQPVYLVTGDLKEALASKELPEDGYQGDVIGESTPDALVSEFMKGEKQLVEKILQTEINLLSSIRDGTALMQHMEDFYYVMLLEKVRSNYLQRVDTSDVSR